MHNAVPQFAVRLGDAVERAVRRHHHRRLERLGWGRALRPAGDSCYADGDPLLPPRPGNAVDVLVDGAEAIPAIAGAIRAARRTVHLAGWHVDPDFAMERRPDRVTLRELLAGAVQRGVEVRVLLWAGAPLPVFKPGRAMAHKVRDRLVDGTGVRCVLDSRERLLHCHHEKLVVVDDEVAFVGGIDLTTLAGDRFDSSDHLCREELGWHDCATRIRGPLVADVAEHFALRWREVAGEALRAVAPPPAAGDVEAQLVRTIPERVYEALPHGTFTGLEAYMRALRGAERLVYLENQFLWSPEVAEVLAAKLRDPPGDDFRLVVLLPAKPNNGRDDTRGQLARLAAADRDGGRLVATTIYARTGPRHGPLYVHAKVGIVDDRWLTIGSTNLNEHSLFNDTEVNVVSCDAPLARGTRERLWAEHLELALDDVRGRDPLELVESVWKPVSKEQRERLDAGQQLTHRLVRLPGVSRRAERLRGPLDSLVVDG